VGKKVRQFFQLIEVVTEKAGSISYLLAYCIMLLIAGEVAVRYIFHSPTVWVWPINQQLFGLIGLFSGTYALLYGRHIRIEILYKRFGSRLKLGSNVLSLSLFLLLMGVLVWQGWVMAESSFTFRQQLPGLFKMPLYPLKMVIPVAVLLFLLQGVAGFFLRKDINKPSEKGFPFR